MDLPEKIDFEALDISLIDLSSQNDFQFSDHNTHDLLGDASPERRAGTDCAIDQFPILHETTEPEITHRKGKYNLRKSIAWDSAFFTSAGVLDPEELSTMLKGPEKNDKQLLPRIEEDISGSNESMSTFETDILTVDSLENDLFGDIRASIQRSNRKAFNSTNSAIKIETMETDSAAISSLQKNDLASETKNPKPTLKKNSDLQTNRLSKSQPKQNMLKLGSGKAVKQDGGHSQVAQSAAKNGESNLVPKPPKVVSRLIPNSTAVTKQDALGRNRTKYECGNSKSVSEKVVQPPKTSILRCAQRPLPKPSLPSKSSSSHSLTTSWVQSRRSHASSDSYNSVSSNASVKSSLVAVRRNPVKSSSSLSASSSPIPKVPSRGALRNKQSPSTPSAYAKSTKIFSSVSPASSISEWSSVSSSSSIINQRSSNSRTSLEMDFCRSLSSDTTLLDPRNHSANQLADGQENLELGLPGNSSTKSSTRVSSLQALVRPSGLRMPSPKIGYFDGVKSSVCTPKKTMQSPSSLHTVIPKSGSAVCSSNRGSNLELKSDKTSTARTVNTAAIKPNTPQAMIPTSFHTCVVTDEKDSPSWSLEGDGYKTGDISSEAQKQVVDAGAGSGAVNENFGLNNETGLDVNKNMGFGGVNIPFVEGINSSGCIGWKVDEDGRVEQNHLENTHQTCNTGDKENHHAKDPGEMLKGLTVDVNPHIPSSMAEILKEISKCASLSPKTATESAVPRFPFAPKNCFCDDASKESASMVANKPAFLLPLDEHNI